MTYKISIVRVLLIYTLFILIGCESQVTVDSMTESESLSKKGQVETAEPGIMHMSVTAATTEFTVQGLQNPASNGSVTVQYDGEQVTTHYNSSWNKYAVANTISSNINNDSSIQLTASVSGSTVELTEKRTGCEYNSNTVYVSHSNGTHIGINDSEFGMSGGDDGDGCDPPESSIDFDVSSHLSQTGIQTIGSAIASTSETVDKISIELELEKDFFFEDYNFVEESNTDQVFAAVTAPHASSGYWTVSGTAEMEDGSVSESKIIYSSFQF